MIPLEDDRKLLTRWNCTKDVFLLFVVTLPFFFITPDMLPITPGTVQETRDCSLKTSLLRGVQKPLLTAQLHCIGFHPFHCSLLLGIAIGQEFPQPHDDFLLVYSTLLFLNLVKSIFFNMMYFYFLIFSMVEILHLWELNKYLLSEC